MLTSLLTCGFLSSGALAQEAPTPPDYPGIVEAFAEARGFMGTVILEHDQKLLFRKSVGKADLEGPLSFVNRSVFPIGSLTKSFTAAAILKLQEDGKLNVTDTLSKFLPDFPGGEKITLQHLLTHTSGIGGLQDIENFDNVQRHALTLDQTIALFSSKPAHFEPGARFEYSNAGYLLLSKVVEVTSGQPFPLYVQSQILQPLGFKSTGFPTRTGIIPRLVKGYLFDGTTHQKAPYVDPELPSGGGGMASTGPELVRWLPLLLSGKVLKPETVQELITPRVPVGEGIHYAYGLQVGSQDGRDVVLHGGIISGHHALTLYFPKEKLSLLILSNVENAPVEELGKTLEKAHFGEPYTLPQKKTFVEVDPAVLQKHLGTYTLPDIGLTLTVVLKDGQLMMQDPAGNLYPLRAENANTFYQGEAGIQIRFTEDGNIELIDGGQTVPGKRVQP
ncbi:hypothetical protein DC3_01270 [Deinococcus cellulosilyticus NBRC 106333 = KACC 11606]|uniref:Beta-lactamase-related domain-containing protein n=2 Tax=Deinococcus cellulosilyticus TaxID=401558 RepID=A0A511MV90_DEIC1|nr:hypothetical protein DC3_01270 [Deinococcus cellulosilyticus NBRC 106333 = KACC 11606]